MLVIILLINIYKRLKIILKYLLLYIYIYKKENQTEILKKIFKINIIIKNMQLKKHL